MNNSTFPIFPENIKPSQLLMLYSFKTLILTVLQKKKDLQYRNKLKKRDFQVPSSGTYLNYGDVIPSSSEIIHGGKIKIVHLQEEFPENDSSFNILYLVSSAQPHFAETIVRWAKKNGVKFIWNQDGVAYSAWAGSNTKSQNEGLRRLIHLADYVIYQSSFCRDSADRFLGSVAVPSEILPNCVDTEKFSPRKESLTPSPWVLLTAGTHQQPERVFTVLRTTAVLSERKKEIRLVLAGRLDWPQAEHEVKETIRNLGLDNQVVFYPAFTQEEAPDLYRQAHVCIHPKYKDPCPTVVIEAMACGLPVIGSNSGGMPELVGLDGGILIDVPESWEQMVYPEPEIMADAVEFIFSDLQRFQAKARERAVAHFSKVRWTDRHRDIFKMVLSARG
jgi:glycosyltransferase involved in cell wall biosynthesis